jgi:hypothetical protein
VNIRCVDEEDCYAYSLSQVGLRSSLRGLAGGSWVQKGSFAAESADPGFSFIYISGTL